MPALSAPDLVKLRSQPHTVKLGFVVINPETVMSARVNNGSIAQGARVIDYDGASGAWANIQNGMTLWVGSAANTYDVGRVRVISATATQLTVAQNSDIVWADNLYLTVKNEYLPWPKFVRIAASVVYKDYDVAWANQTITWAPVPVLGGPAVAVIANDGFARLEFDGSESYTVDGSTITGYSWTFPGGTLPGGNQLLATPGQVSWMAAGVYQVSCTITASNGRTTTGHRTVVIIGNGAMNGNFVLDNLSGTIEDGWTVSLRVHDATAASIPDHAQVLIYEIATMGGTAGSVGYETNRANIKFAGYVTEGTVRLDPLTNDTLFNASSVCGLMQRQFGWPTFVQDKTTATSWNEAQDLDMNRAYHYLIYWHTTLMEVADVLIQSDTSLIKVANYPQGTPWGMLKDFAFATRMARVGVTKGGRILLRRDPQYLAVASRATIAEFFTLQPADWQGELQIPEMFTPTVAWVDLSGVFYSGNPSTELQPFFSKAPSKDNPKYYGSTEEVQYLVLNSQSEANIMSGMVLAQRNNVCPELPLKLAGNWSSALDPAYQEYVRMPVAGFDTKRGFMLVNARLIVRGQTLSHDAAGGVLTTEVRLELETSGPAGETYTLPAEVPPPTETCPPGTVYNPGTGLCEAVTICPPGTVWNPDTQTCDKVTGPSWRSHLIMTFDGGGAYEAFDVTGPSDPSQPTWTQINTGLAALNIKQLVADPWHPGDRQYVIMHSAPGADSKLYRRESGGAWVEIATALGLTGESGAYLFAAFGDINQEGFLGLFTSHFVWALDYRVSYFYSHDFGTTWSSKIDVWNPGDVNSTLVAAAQFDLIGAFKGTSPYGAGQVVYAPCFSAGSHTSTSLQRSFDKGLTWSSGIGSVDLEQCRFHLDPSSQDTSFLAGYDPVTFTIDGIRRSTDHGLSFAGDTLGAGIAHNNRQAFSPVYNSAGAATAWRQTARAPNQARIYKTIDSGASYYYGVTDAVLTNSRPWSVSIVMDSPNYLYLFAEQDLSNATDPCFYVAEDPDGASGYAIHVVNKSGAGGNQLPGKGGGCTGCLQVWT